MSNANGHVSFFSIINNQPLKFEWCTAPERKSIYPGVLNKVTLCRFWNFIEHFYDLVAILKLNKLQKLTYRVQVDSLKFKPSSYIVESSFKLKVHYKLCVLQAIKQTAWVFEIWPFYENQQCGNGACIFVQLTQP